MESYIGGWTGDEDLYYDDHDSSSIWAGDPNQDEDSLMEYADEQDDWDEDNEWGDDPDLDNYDDPNDY